jgi:hypothetical protein
LHFCDLKVRRPFANARNGLPAILTLDQVEAAGGEWRAIGEQLPEVKNTGGPLSRSK